MLSGYIPLCRSFFRSLSFRDGGLAFLVVSALSPPFREKMGKGTERNSKREFHFKISQQVITQFRKHNDRTLEAWRKARPANG